jgi:hypothetical protein
MRSTGREVLEVIKRSTGREVLEEVKLDKKNDPAGEKMKEHRDSVRELG